MIFILNSIIKKPIWKRIVNLNFYELFNYKHKRYEHKGKRVIGDFCFNEIEIVDIFWTELISSLVRYWDWNLKIYSCGNLKWNVISRLGTKLKNSIISFYQINKNILLRVVSTLARNSWYVIYCIIPTRGNDQKEI